MNNTITKLDTTYAKLAKEVRPGYLRKIIAGAVWTVFTILGMTLAGLWSFYGIFGWIFATVAAGFGMEFMERRSDTKYEVQKRQVADVIGQIKKIKLRI